MAVATVVVLTLAWPVGAAERIALPLALVRGSPPAAPTARPTPSPLPPVTWSEVLADVPVYPGMRLVFFEARPQDAPPLALALHDPPAAMPAVPTVLAWYGEHLAAYGWRRLSADATGGRWSRADAAWLTVRYGAGADGVVRLALMRDPGGARAPSPMALAAAVPLPDDARRVRFDLADLLPEEVAMARPAADARLWLERRLAAAGWQEVRVVVAGDMTYLRFERAGASLLLGIRPTGPEASTVGLGLAGCLPSARSPDQAVNPATSVYLAEVPTPRGLDLAGFERWPAQDQVEERWRGLCQDLDIVAADYGEQLARHGWVQRPDGLARWPGQVSWDAEPANGSPHVTVELRVAGAGNLNATLRRGGAGRRVPRRASLLWPDVPLPAGAEAWRLEGPTVDGWLWRETNRFPPALAPLVATWYRGELAETAWHFQRLEPEGIGPAQVYGAGGEELLASFELGSVPAVVLSRRRVCASDLPVLPPAEARPARWLAEMLVYPGAVYDAFDPPTERYLVRCGSSDLIADWYRIMLERGNWSLVSTEWPHDPERRRLQFARPGERGWPPERRTAFAEVVVERVWPYTFRVSLRRDPAGVLPGGAAE